MIAVRGKTMKPFHTIAIPHKDILEGRLTMDVFAADLFEASQQRCPDAYKDAELMRIMNYLQSKFETLEIELIATDGKIANQDIEDKIKEAFRQLGIEIELEE
jgi:hypothetical protein